MSNNIPRAAELAAQCSAGLFEAMRAAKRDIKGGVFRSRGKWIRVLSGQDSLVNNGDLEFKGTQKQLDAVLAEYCGKPGVTAIYIEGGVDWSNSVRDFYEGDYEPWVTEWAVDIWIKE